MSSMQSAGNVAVAAAGAKGGAKVRAKPEGGRAASAGLPVPVPRRRRQERDPARAGLGRELLWEALDRIETQAEIVQREVLALRRLVALQDWRQPEGRRAEPGPEEKTAPG